MNEERRVVLVADDDPDILALVRTVLERAGYEVVTATNGAEAVEVARARKPDLAVLDVSMPELDGLGALRQLRADPETKGITAIFLSARAELSQVAEGFDAGATAYVRKPFTPQELRDRVAEALGSSAARQPGGR